MLIANLLDIITFALGLPFSLISLLLNIFFGA